MTRLVVLTLLLVFCHSTRAAAVPTLAEPLTPAVSPARDVRPTDEGGGADAAGSSLPFNPLIGVGVGLGVTGGGLTLSSLSYAPLRLPGWQFLLAGEIELGGTGVLLGIDAGARLFDSLTVGFNFDTFTRRDAARASTTSFFLAGATLGWTVFQTDRYFVHPYAFAQGGAATRIGAEVRFGYRLLDWLTFSDGSGAIGLTVFGTVGISSLTRPADEGGESFVLPQAVVSISPLDVH